MRFLILLFLALSLQAEAKIHRSSTAKAHFVKAHPCPATGLPRGACPGWVVDHIEPLCNGGADDPANMQWQTKENALIKDRIEWAVCRKNRK